MGLNDKGTNVVEKEHNVSKEAAEHFEILNVWMQDGVLHTRIKDKRTEKYYMFVDKQAVTDGRVR